MNNENNLNIVESINLVKNDALNALNNKQLTIEEYNQLLELLEKIIDN